MDFLSSLSIPSLPILPLLLILPILGAVFCFLIKNDRRHTRHMAILFSGVTLALSLLLLYDISSRGYVESESYAWINTAYLQMNLDIGVDGMSMLMVLLTALLVLMVAIFSDTESERSNSFFALIMATQAGLMGVYLAQDYFLFFIFWEVALIPMFFLIAGWGGPRRHYASMKFLIYTHVASMIMLIGIFMLVITAADGGVLNFSFEAVKAASAAGLFTTTFQVVVFGLLFFGFAVKMPLVPFHTWLPDAHVEAPTAGSVLLAGVMLKMGSYAIIRICLEVLPEGAIAWQTVMIVLALVAILYGAYACIAQKDLKKMVAFSSISHMGFVLLGIATLSGIGIQFAIFQMFAHGLITSVLFMVCGIVGHNTGTRDIPLLGGLAGKMPIFAGFMMFGFLASLGLPGLIGFVAEFGVLMAFFDYLMGIDVLWPIVFALASLMLTAGYFTWAMQRSIFGKETTKIDMSNVHDVNRREGVALGLLCALIALFGIMPWLIMDVLAEMPLVLLGVV
ncbi:MAG: NADH-quinone oxidoreductase subunit M [Methanomassiliicoccaceae archaeon]|nr:NADH-quinone oxidoreductase subunit M [Methanomassiliicoccaceae archaeon]